MEHGSTEEALLYLFLAAALGSLVGNISWRGHKLGVATILFVGLAIGALKPDVQIPEVIKMLGLAMFVYSIGLSSGPSFFNSFKKRGTANLILAITALSTLSLLLGIVAIMLGFDASAAAGMLSGITTNTPALAGLLDAIHSRPNADSDAMTRSAVVGYSISYPMGVLGLMIAVALLRRWFRIDFAAEAQSLNSEFPSGRPIVNRSLVVTNPEVAGKSLRVLNNQYLWPVVFGRLRRGTEDWLCHWDSVLELGDEVGVTGENESVEQVIHLFGEPNKEQLAGDQSVFATRRMFISNAQTAGKTVAALNLHEQYQVVLTRIRHGDLDSLVHADTVLELGDRIRVLAKQEDMKALEKLFGDSYEQLSHIDLLPFGLGMGLGILIGSIEMTLPGDILFSLGFAGGPLVAGLLLSYIRRSGPVLWTLPYSANLTLRQIGLILMLAAIGINSGAAFLSTMLSPAGPLMFTSAALVSIIGSILILTAGYKWLKIPFSLLIGMLSHHPANLDYANNVSGNKIPTYGYALVYPLLLIGKIVFVQMLWQVLRHWQ